MGSNKLLNTIYDIQITFKKLKWYLGSVKTHFFLTMKLFETIPILLEAQVHLTFSTLSR